MSSTLKKEPLIRITKRDGRPFMQAMIIRLIAVLLALLVSAVFIFTVTHLDPVSVYTSMFKGAFGTVKRGWITIRDCLYLLLIAVGLAPAFKMKFWNTGAEGQVLVGGLVTAGIMIYCGETMSTPMLLVVMFIASAIAGAIWGWIPAYFKAKFNTNETLFTLMMNYVGIQLVEFFVDVWDKKQSHSVGIINMNTKAGWFPTIGNQQYLLNVIIVLGITFLVYCYLKYTKQGYEISVVGESEQTAKYAGINVKNVIMRTMILSGALCGIAGFVEVAGISHTISKETAGGKGFTAIIVCWLAKFDAISMIIISLLLVFLDKGANQIASDFNLNQYASNVVTGIILFFILGSEFFLNYNVIFRHKKEVK